jgi:peptidyl-prolyl cis-trans isomerase B (cyclophilin B)
MNIRRNQVIAFLQFIFCVLVLLTCNRDPKTYVVIETKFGPIRVMLYDSTSRHRDNFLQMTTIGYYQGLLFHQVVPDYFIVGGDPDSKTSPRSFVLGNGGPGFDLTSEIGSPHLRGALAMMRAPNAREKQSSGSVFFIVIGKKITDQELDRYEKEKGIKYNAAQRKLYKKIGGAPWLDNEYTVFGEVTTGMDIVERISKLPRDKRDRPKEDVRMQVRILN